MALKWGLGVVESPEPGHEHLVGRLVIPYYNKSGVIGLKFRCMVEHDCRDENSHQKYMVPAGQEDYLYNVVACDTSGDVIHVTEGESDCWILSSIVPEPVVAVPGAGKWRPHWGSHFKGFDRVILWPDGDKAGRDMGNRWRKEIQSVEVVTMPSGFDVCSLFQAEGPEVFLKLTGASDER